MNRFMVYVLITGKEWACVSGHGTLPEAVAAADREVTRVHHVKSCVMEIGGTDAVPTFTFKYGAKK